MNTAGAIPKYWKTPAIFVIGLSAAGLLIAPLFTTPGDKPSSQAELFKPYREDIALNSAAVQVLAESQFGPRTQTTR